jgi:hypothetical protein
MLLVLEQDVAPDPTDVGFFGADVIVFDSQLFTDAVRQFPGFGLFGHHSPSSQLPDQKCCGILVQARLAKKPHGGMLGHRSGDSQIGLLTQ